MLYGWILGKGTCYRAQHERKRVISAISPYAEENEARLCLDTRDDVVYVNETLVRKRGAVKNDW